MAACHRHDRGASLALGWFCLSPCDHHHVGAQPLLKIHCRIFKLDWLAIQSNHDERFAGSAFGRVGGVRSLSCSVSSVPRSYSEVDSW